MHFTIYIERETGNVRFIDENSQEVDYSEHLDVDLRMDKDNPFRGVPVTLS